MVSGPRVRPAGDPVARAVTRALHRGDLAALDRLLRDHPGLAGERIGDRPSSRSLLHVLADHPGHRPRAAALAAMLVRGGAEVDGRFDGSHAETPLHWAASSGDVVLLDALLDAGADIEARGGVIGGGTPLADAVAFRQWPAARRLVERGASVNLWQAAALGLLTDVAAALDLPAPSSGGAGAAHRPKPPPPSPQDVTEAFWCACHGGQLAAARLLLERGADRDWRGFDDLTPLGAAHRSGSEPVVAWLIGLGAST